MGRYDDVYNAWRKDPESFWAEAAKEIDWVKPWDRVLDDTNPPFYRWFAGGELNTAYNCLDRHVEGGRADQAAIIYDSPMTGNVERLTYRDLRDRVALFAGALCARGVGKGDRVIIYMPMIPETAVAMLACARIGAVHSVVFGGFAPNELATRIDDAKPKLIIAATCGLEPGRVIEYMPLIHKAIDLSKHKPDGTIVYARPEVPAFDMRAGDMLWDDALKDAEPAECVTVKATDPLYVLYTSGTTGQPKGVVRDNGGHAVALKWSMKNLYDVDPGTTFWAASDVGWVVGHSYIVYAPLLHGATAILFEGKPVGTPDPGTFWRVIADHDVQVMFTAPTAFRAIKQQDPKGEFIGKYDLSKFRILFLAGERADSDTIQWAEKQLEVPVIDHWWQTETGWPMAINPMGMEALPVRYGSPGKPVPGYDIRIVSEQNEEVKRGDMGAIVVKLPLPPGALPTLWNADQRFRDAYLTDYPGYYKTADAGYMDEDGYLYVMARTDDIINVAGHRLSTGAMEEVLSQHPDVAECAVFGVADQMKGQLPLGMIVLKAGVERDVDEIRNDCIQMIRNQIGAVAAFRLVTPVKRLPKTRSGKVLRATMQKIADGEEFKTPATIDDPAILDEIRVSLEDLGYPKR
ncbi:MAG: propionyl-CoA synthetase [Rhizobiales bacterium NRL2]|jgi:propionyl-CoA synthetase|nr:MAG: propionyl-CoA synthetase [Rhizobiales bacterium NRL2]